VDGAGEVMNTFQGRPLSWWYVNLTSRIDRDEHAKAEFARHGIDARRFAGFLPDEWPGDLGKVKRMRKRTPGAVGCYQSQTHVIRTVVDTDRVVVVCEDDVCFCDDLPQRLAYIEEHLTWDWDVFYLGATFHVPGVWCIHPECKEWGGRGRDMDVTEDKHIMRVYGEWGTYCYMVNGRNARKVLKALDDMVADSDGIDHNFIRIGDGLNCYCFVPGCVWQFDSMSSIGGQRNAAGEWVPSKTIFSGFKKLGPYAWTTKMSDFDPATYDWDTGRMKK
jgi:GR25 family glycosyltransferase involved in LPS biosynthesis